MGWRMENRRLFSGENRNRFTTNMQTGSGAQSIFHSPNKDYLYYLFTVLPLKPQEARSLLDTEER
jgi:hypothetical protein